MDREPGGDPTTTRVTGAGMRRSSAPYPIRSTVIDGIGPNEDVSAFIPLGGRGREPLG